MRELTDDECLELSGMYQDGYNVKENELQAEYADTFDELDRAVTRPCRIAAVKNLVDHLLWITREND